MIIYRVLLSNGKIWKHIIVLKLLLINSNIEIMLLKTNYTWKENVKQYN